MGSAREKLVKTADFRAKNITWIFSKKSELLNIQQRRKVLFFDP
jgi:hypothetical protein